MVIYIPGDIVYAIGNITRGICCPVGNRRVR